MGKIVVLGEILQMKSDEIKVNADRILYEFGLLKKLEEVGKTHIIGSYRMNMMAWNDLDIDIENQNISQEKLYEMTIFILNRFHPVWYEGKEEINDKGKKIWFLGFETMITGDLWNVDLWFFDRETIANTEAFYDNITKNATQAQKDAVIKIKKCLIAKGLYSDEKYKSIDVYRAVMEKDVKTIEEFLTEDI